MQVGVGVELPGDEVLDLARRRGVDVRQAVDAGIDEGAVGGVAGLGRLRRLANDKDEGEGELVIVGELKDEARRARRRRRLGVLQHNEESAHQPRDLDGRGDGQATDLDEFYGRAVAEGARCRYSGSRKCIGNDVDRGAPPRGRDDERRDGYWR